jgi:hypothetical protein
MKKYILRVFEDMVLRLIFGLKRDVITGNCKIFCDETHHNLYSSPNIIRNAELRQMG